MLQYDQKKLGEFLKKSREDANLTQSDISRRLKYSSPQFISNIERGVSTIPMKTLGLILSWYKVNPKAAVKIILESQEKLLTETMRRLK